MKQIKTHDIHRNEQADKLAKEAIHNNYISYIKIPASAIKYNLWDNSIRKWQTLWNETTKGATTKEFFPSVNSRLSVNLKLSPNITTIMSGHGNIKSYLHRFKIIDSAECSCSRGMQTVDHLIYECSELDSEHEALKISVLKKNNWPINKCDLISKYTKEFIKYINSMDFKKLNSEE